MNQKYNRFVVPIKPAYKDSSNVTAIVLGSIPNDRMKTMPAVSLMMVNKQQSVVELQFESISAAFPKSEMILVVGHDGQQVIEKRPKQMRIVENQLYEQCGEVEELKLAINNVTTDAVLIIKGNTIFDSKAIKQLRNHGSCTMIDKKDQMTKDALGVISNGSKIENIAYGVEDKWCYTTYLEGRELKILRKFVNMRIKSKMCLFEALNYIVSNGGLIYCVGQQEGYLRQILSPKDVL